MHYWAVGMSTSRMWSTTENHFCLCIMAELSYRIFLASCTTGIIFINMAINVFHDVWIYLYVLYVYSASVIFFCFELTCGWVWMILLLTSSAYAEIVLTVNLAVQSHCRLWSTTCGYVCWTGTHPIGWKAIPPFYPVASGIQSAYEHGKAVGD
jgi:hypothetical protein